MNSKVKFWIVFSLIAVFVIGVAAGYFSERYLVHKRHEPRPGERNRSGPRFPTLEILTKELSLSQGQKDQIREIFKRNEDRLKAFGEEFHKRVSEMRSQIKNEINAVLTPEQKQKLEAMINTYIGKREAQHEETQRAPSRQKNKGEVK
jgi:Spy/CpxP family protein refolding chaperone